MLLCQRHLLETSAPGCYSNTTALDAGAVVVLRQPNIKIGLHLLQHSYIFFLVSFPVNGTLWMENLLAVDVSLLTRQSVVRAEGFFSGSFFLKATYQRATVKRCVNEFRRRSSPADGASYPSRVLTSA